jgi:SAM-dependent methyltransferase
MSATFATPSRDGGGLLPDDVEGWLTEAQASRLDAAARRVPAGGRIVEIGSFRGRSTIVLARAAGETVEVVAIDPHMGSDRGPQEIEADAGRGDADFALFHANLRRHGVDERVRHVRALSQAALDDVDGPVDVLWVDGAHRYGPALEDLVRWGARVRPGGAMLVHDAFSSIGVTLALLRGVVFSSGWRYVGRAGSLVEYTRAPAGRSSALRQLALLPWFAKNVVLKVLTVLRLRRGPWPY